MESIRLRMVPAVPKRHLCTCGHKQVSMKNKGTVPIWPDNPELSASVMNQWYCYCRFCGKEGPKERTQFEAVIGWNKMFLNIKEERV